MKRKFLSILMLGALIVTSATMTSCKDYDDDINANTSKIADLQTQIDKLNTDLTNCKTSCQTDIAKAQSTADAATALANAAQAAADKAQAAADANAAQLAEQLKMINGKVDQKEFSDSISSLISQILGINETLLTLADKDKALENSIIANQAAIADIQGQIATLNEFMTAIKSLDLVNKFPALQQDVADLKTKTDQTIKDLNDVKSDLQKKYDELKQSISDTNVKVDANTGKITINTQAIADNKAAIDQLKKDME
jgi:chromosome segregation ATPase